MRLSNGGEFDWRFRHRWIHTDIADFLSSCGHVHSPCVLNRESTVTATIPRHGQCPNEQAHAQRAGHDGEGMNGVNGRRHRAPPPWLWRAPLPPRPIPGYWPGKEPTATHLTHQ